MEFRACIYTEDAYGYDEEPMLAVDMDVDYEDVDIEKDAFSPLTGHYTYVAYSEFESDLRNQSAVVEALEEQVKKCQYEDPEIELLVVFERLEQGRYEEYLAIPVERTFKEEPLNLNAAVREFLECFDHELNGGY